MPRGDKTGPSGMGPMTGRGAGYCAGFGIAGYGNSAPGAGFGRGRGSRWCGFGGGRGWRHTFYATGQPGWMRFGGYADPYRFGAPYPEPDPEMQERGLKGRAEALEAELDSIRQRISEIESGKTSKG